MKNTLEKCTLEQVYNFVSKYGDTALTEALQNYENSYQIYICKTRGGIARIPIHSINYIEIFGHTIIIHSDNGCFRKYGTLTKEYEQLKKLGFVKCNQSILVPIEKIKEIERKCLILTTGDKFSLSRSCAASVICEYARGRN
ncbi:MAG: LytTR family DNA-binding domain-containing protein [Eubacteriales bacterium]|nr:LytTR family DNA-binding domain-containing protein [Eubacteriales bacterium]